MNESSQKSEYRGFEQGPIRPPSEAYSLLIRVTRNCPWNQCTFCPVYKGDRFSLRPVAHVIKDIDSVHAHVKVLQNLSDADGRISRIDLDAHMATLKEEERTVFHAALNWFSAGMQSIFLQDANSLIVPPEDLVTLLKHIKSCFPWVLRITSYARSHTVARISDQNMKAIADAGLNRVHIGMESGSDVVLKMVKKGGTKEMHIRGGLKVKAAGMELSEYVMPGLGGRQYSKIHATETADALNQINPDFIRLRSLAIPNSVPLFEDFIAGRFEKLTDIETAEEIRLFLERLDGITSTIKSDHILNLFEEVEGRLPEDKPAMIAVIQTFLDSSDHDRMLYQVGRRLGLLHRLDDLESVRVREQIESLCDRYGITPEKADEFINEMMKRFI